MADILPEGVVLAVAEGVAEEEAWRDEEWEPKEYEDEKLLEYEDGMAVVIFDGNICSVALFSLTAAWIKCSVEF